MTDSNTGLNNVLVITNLRICFLKSDIDVLVNIIKNDCQFIPLDYVQFEVSTVSLGKIMSGQNNKIKVTVSNFSENSKFEKL